MKKRNASIGLIIVIILGVLSFLQLRSRNNFGIESLPFISAGVLIFGFIFGLAFLLYIIFGKEKEILKEPVTIYPVLWRQVLGLLFVSLLLIGLGIGRKVLLPNMILVFIGLLTFIDAWTSGIYKKKGLSSIINLSPLGWAFVMEAIFILGFPLYLANRNKIKTKEGKENIFLGVKFLGSLIFALMVLELIVEIYGKF